MNQQQIKKLLENWDSKRERTIVIIDYANVYKWQETLGWVIGIPQLATLVKKFSTGKLFLRRFYYGSDFGPKEATTTIRTYSKAVLDLARYNGLEVVTKPVKYIHLNDGSGGYQMKCDLDVEMTVDLIRERDNYDRIVLFSGDGDLSYTLRYLHQYYNKECYVFGARNHTAREIFDAQADKVISKVFFVEDFEYRLIPPTRYRSGRR